MARSLSAFVRYIVRLPSRRDDTRPTSLNTIRCFDTDGWFSSSLSAISETDRSSPAMNSRMCRRRGSAIALNGSEVVAALAMDVFIYSYMGISQAGDFWAVLAE